jgi:hypothetical protein
MLTQAPAPPLAEFSAAIYGSLVSTLLDITESIADVNAKLDAIGYRVGRRLAHEFARDGKLERVDTEDSVISNVLLRIWQSSLGWSAARAQKLSPPEAEHSRISIAFDPSFYTRNVNVPPAFNGLEYKAILPGAIRGILEVFHREAKVTLQPTSGGPTEVLIEMIREIPVAVPKDED